MNTLSARWALALVLMVAALLAAVLLPPGVTGSCSGHIPVSCPIHVDHRVGLRLAIVAAGVLVALALVFTGRSRESQ
jgi:hypothetical protein